MTHDTCRVDYKKPDKTKLIGKHCICFYFIRGNGKNLPGIAVDVNGEHDFLDHQPTYCPGGEWLRIKEAKELHRQLGEAIEYWEKGK